MRNKRSGILRWLSFRTLLTGFGYLIKLLLLLMLAFRDSYYSLISEYFGEVAGQQFLLFKNNVFTLFRGHDQFWLIATSLTLGVSVFNYFSVAKLCFSYESNNNVRIIKVQTKEKVRENKNCHKETCDNKLVFVRPVFETVPSFLN